MDKELAVKKFIDENFEPDSITVEKCNLFPFGLRIKDKVGGEMIIYFDLLTNEVKWVFPDKSQKM